MLDDKTLNFFSELKKTGHVLKNYVSWNKIKENNKKLDNYINILKIFFINDGDSIDKKVNDIFLKNEQKCFWLLPFFLGYRQKSKKDSFVYLDENDVETFFNYNDPNSVSSFIYESGLKDNLFDYFDKNNLKALLLGIEIGISSNDKKNKVGKYMENSVEKLFRKYNINNYQKQIEYSKFAYFNEENFKKKFDFVFVNNGIKYCIETSFFNSQGSKINSEGNRFIALNEIIKKSKNMDLVFVWIVDGPGIKTSSDLIQKALNSIENMYNLKTFENFLSKLKLKDFTK